MNSKRKNAPGGDFEKVDKAITSYWQEIESFFKKAFRLLVEQVKEMASCITFLVCLVVPLTLNILKKFTFHYF